MKPTRRALGCLALLLPFVVVWPELDTWMPAFGLFAGVLAIDGWMVWRQAPAQMRRTLPPTLAVNRNQLIRLEMRTESAVGMALRVAEEPPEDTDIVQHTDLCKLAKGQLNEVRYWLKPLRRGDLKLQAILQFIRSPLGLWERRVRSPLPQSVRIYPDFELISQYLHLAADQHSQRLGLKRLQRRGEGLEFHQLREFHDGDTLRQIDWKATARRRELISREYTEERDQRVVFLLDTGSRMRAMDGNLSHFDHALNALLLLAYVALRQGDTVSVATFGPVQRWISDLRGPTAVNRLLNELYDLESAPGAADFAAAAQQLMTRQRKRALVVLVTNVRHTDEDLMPAVQALRKRHAVLIASLIETELRDAIALPVERSDDVLTVAGTARYLAQRNAARKRMERMAQIVLDSTPAELPAALVNGYWALKRAGVL